MKKKNPSTKAGADRDDRHFADDSAQAQRLRLHDALRIAPVSTIEARRNLDILMPGTRVHELRHREGYRIETHWIMEPTDCGKLHRVAKYVLLPGRSNDQLPQPGQFQPTAENGGGDDSAD